MILGRFKDAGKVANFSKWAGAAVYIIGRPMNRLSALPLVSCRKSAYHDSKRMMNPNVRLDVDPIVLF